MPLFSGLSAHSDNKHILTAKREGSGGVAGLDSSKILITSQLPPCVESFAYSSCEVNNVFLHYDEGACTCTQSLNPPHSITLKTNTGAVGNAGSRMRRTYPVDTYFLQFGCHIRQIVDGVGGIRDTAIGFIEIGISPPTGNYAVFSHKTDNKWYCRTSDGVNQHDDAVAPILGREIAANDMLAVRMGYDVRGGQRYASFYVNGQLIIKYTDRLPTGEAYAGAYVYAGDALITTSRDLEYDSYHMTWMV